MSVTPNLRRMVSRLTVRQLRIVLAVRDNGSLVAAAKHLGTTQPTISKALQDTEALVGVELFSRTNRGVVPTVFGEVLAAHSRLIISQLRHAATEIEDLRDGAGRITAGTLLSASADLLPHAIARLRLDRPTVGIAIIDGTNDRLLPELSLGKLDLIVGRQPERDKSEGLHFETLINDISCVVARAGHPLIGREGLTLADLADCSWVLPRPETTMRHQIDAAFREQNASPPRHAVDSVSQLINRRLVLDHDYLSAWPWLVAHREVQDGHIAVLPFRLRATRSAVGITTRADSQPSAATRAFIRALRSVSASMETYQSAGM
jgi:DNA-binding transcriptional LysR family regulator